MPSPVEFMMQYRDISVDRDFIDSRAMLCRVDHIKVRLNKYFMMNWHPGTPSNIRYNSFLRGQNNDSWFLLYQEDIRTAAMGKGAPDDYGRALRWALHSGRIDSYLQSDSQHFYNESLGLADWGTIVTHTNVQRYFDDNLGLDCSGFATNYLIANGRMPNKNGTKRDTGAINYFNPANAVNDFSDIRQGDLLVYMNGNTPMRPPAGTGHVMVVESFSPVCTPTDPLGSGSGTIQVVECTPSQRPSLSTSPYTVEKVIPKAGRVPCMILVVKRLKKSGFHVSVMRV